MAFIKQDKTNWKYILIVVILAILVGGWILLGLTLPIPPPWQPISLTEQCKAKFLLWCEKCRSYGWSGELDESRLLSDEIKQCLEKYFKIISPETADCGVMKEDCKNFGIGVTEDETTNWKTYQWNNLEFKYPPTWTVEKTYYQTPAQQAGGESPENIGLAIFPGIKATGNDFIFIGGHQVSCDPSENHTKCQFISSISDFIYTDSNNPDILEVFDQMLSTLRLIDTSKCSSTQIEGYKTEEIVKEDLDGDNQQEVIRIYIEDKEDLGNKPIIVKVFSGKEDCPQALFYYQGTGNVVWGTQVFSNFWGDGAKAVLIKDVSYAGGSGSTVNITFLTYRQGQYQIIKGPKFSGHDWRCCKFDGDNGLGKKIIGAEHWWGLNYEYYCAGCTSPLQFIIYTWNGEGYTKTVAGITQNSYGPESIDEILEKEPAVLNPQ